MRPLSSPGARQDADAGRRGTAKSPPDCILATWTAFEVLSPQSFVRPEELTGGDRSAVVPLENRPLPWERGEKSRPKYRLYYQIVLGSVPLEPAINRLLERFSDDRPEKPSARGNAPLAVVVVGRSGKLVKSPALAVSSFGWGVMTALGGGLSELANWPAAEKSLAEYLEDQLLGPRNSGAPEEERREQPLTIVALRRAFDALVNALDLPPDLVQPPTFLIRTHIHFKDPNPPEPVLLNSFYLGDLARARQLFRGGHAPENLKRYLGVTSPPGRRDLLNERNALEDAVSPERTPLARWPSLGRHPLALLQQAAVNLAFAETPSTGLVGINGPPGTGKTTLLRDMVAGVITERAAAMVKYADPDSAFQHSGEKLKAGEAWLHLYRLAEALRGFEMVVASSNNRAVENVSAELPNLKSVAADAGLRYFKTVADAVHERETWGLIAAVLGKSENRTRFRNAFWWDDDAGMRRYLAAAAGTPQQVEEKDASTGEVRYRPPRVVAEEHPPASHEAALESWRKAQARFHAALAKSRTWQASLASVRRAVAALPSLMAELAACEERTQRAEREQERSALTRASAQAAVENMRAMKHLAETACANHARRKPGLIARTFSTKRAKEWWRQNAPLVTDLQGASCALARAEAGAAASAEALGRAVEGRSEERTARATAQANAARAETVIREARERYGVVIADKVFFEQEHSAKHRSTPWFTNAAQNARDEFFRAAVDVHRAFIDAAAKPLRHNLGVLMNVLNTQSLPGAAKQALLGDLWASLFLVVPVVSTTFASVERMLGRLPSESLGWLFVDEAGQAQPQAAVGALMRSRRAIILGDPVQLEPIVQLPGTLRRAICQQMGVDHDRFSAPDASVQSLADAGSTYASEFQTRNGSRSVGVPLLVHRRCVEPMFSVSNNMAYSGLMVSARESQPSPLRDVLGPSRWIDVAGESEDKWCAEEGAVVLQLLRKLAAHRVPPDLYIITPFRTVADRLRKLVCDSGLLAEWIEDDPREWTAKRIGTVHTAQGREAEGVILVLGAPSPAQARARNWAGARPNLLNVAVTRARDVFYVVGNRDLWREAGVFSYLDERLP